MASKSARHHKDTIRLTFTAAQMRTIRTAAHRSGAPVASWVACALTSFAKTHSADEKFSEQKPCQARKRQ
jgi:hypothetical protein